jgi:hypothetical protein
VAGQDILGNMVSEGYLTTPTAKGQATPATLNEGGTTPAIEKQYHLCLPGYRFVNGLYQMATENAPVTRLKLISHIHHLNLGQRCPLSGDNSLWKPKQVIISGLSLIVSLYGRGSATQHHHRPG